MNIKNAVIKTAYLNEMKKIAHTSSVVKIAGSWLPSIIGLGMVGGVGLMAHNRLKANAINFKSRPTKAISKPVTSKPSNIIDKGIENIKKWENSKSLGTYKNNKWHPYKDRGKWAIGYGVRIDDRQYAKYKNGIDDTTADKLAKDILAKKAVLAKKAIPKFDKFPEDVQVAILNGFYRGDLSGSPKTIKLLNNGNFSAAADEFLKNKEYRRVSNKSGIKKRMEYVANTLRGYSGS